METTYQLPILCLHIRTFNMAPTYRKNGVPLKYCKYFRDGIQFIIYKPARERPRFIERVEMSDIHNFLRSVTD